MKSIHVLRRDIAAASVIGEANARMVPNRIFLEMTVARSRPTTPTPKPSATPPKAPRPAPARPKANRALEVRQARDAGALVLSELRAAVSGAVLDARRQECRDWHRLRAQGWRPLPDATWRGPNGQVLDPSKPIFPTSTTRRQTR
ncbi:MAG TPA: hypothetical protein VGM19_12070 [Armatimonadota bacterium]|jgi:hypothetical protein